MPNILEIIFKGVDQTSDEAKKVSGSIEGISGAAKKTSSALDTAFGVLAATQFQRFGDAAGQLLGRMVSEATEAQATMVQLEQVIKSTGGAAGLSAGDVEKLAQKFADLTVYEDDAIIAGQTLLLQFDNVNKTNLDQVTGVMVDLSTRMGVDIPSAAKVLGKALEGELGGLARYGVILDDQTKKNIDDLIKMGDTAAATQIILDAITGKVGGAAEAEARTFGGLLARIKKDWADALETMGTALTDNPQIMSFLTTLDDAIRGLTDTFAKLPDSVQTGIVALVGLVALLGQAAPVLISLKVLLGGAGLSGAFTALAGAIGAITLPMLALAAAIGALVAVVITMGPDALETFKNIATFGPKLLIAGFQRIVFEVKKFVTDFINLVRRLGTMSWEEFKKVGAAIPSAILGGIKAEWNLLIEGVQELINSLLEKFDLELEIKSPSKVMWRKGELMAQGLLGGFNTGVGATSLASGGLLTSAPAMAYASHGGMGGVQVQTVKVYGELSPEARRRMRREAEDMAFSAVQIANRRRGR